MGASGFRAKILSAMLGLVIGVTGTTLYVTQRAFQAEYRQRFEEIFALHRELFSSRQQWIVNALEQQLLLLVRKQRIQLALLESDASTLYEQVRDELVVRGLLPQQGEPVSAGQVSHFVFLDADGDPLLPNGDSRTDASAVAPPPAIFSALHRLDSTVAGWTQPSMVYLSLPGSGGTPELHQAVFAPVVDNATGDHLGVFGLVSRVESPADPGRDHVKGGVYFEGALYSLDVDPPEKQALAQVVQQSLTRNRPAPDDLSFDLRGVPHRVLYKQLDQAPGVPEAWLVALIPMAEAIAGEQRLRRKVLALGSGGLLLSLALSGFMSRSLTRPIADLVRGTVAVREGAFDYRVAIRTRDEIGQLSSAFNEMAAGLGQRERLRSILDMVADKEVAHELLSGNILLGGEIREVSVLFCDIRGFTSLSEGMSPPDVIRMLNEHFSPLTRLVYEHHGVVDKFVGDLIMAIFGAPRSHGDDAFDAAQCALAMIRARREMNERSSPPIEIGIGVASGLAVAGCVGAAERQNYTVLGARINLASRLCGKAGRMEVVIDAATQAKLRNRLATRPLGTLELKGFAAPVEAFALLEPSHGDAA